MTEQKFKLFTSFPGTLICHVDWYQFTMDKEKGEKRLSDSMDRVAHHLACMQLFGQS